MICSIPEKQFKNFRISDLRCNENWAIVCVGNSIDIRFCAQQGGHKFQIPSFDRLHQGGGSHIITHVRIRTRMEKHLGYSNILNIERKT